MKNVVVLVFIVLSLAIYISAIPATAEKFVDEYKDLLLLERILQKLKTNEEKRDVITAFIIIKPSLKDLLTSNNKFSNIIQNITNKHPTRCGTPYVLKLLEICEKYPALKDDVQAFLTTNLEPKNLDRTYETEHFRIHYTITGDDAVPTDDDNGIRDWTGYTDVNGNGKWDPGEPLNDDVGQDGIPYTGDPGEGNGIPDQGEPNAEPDYVERVGEYLEKAWQTEIEDWGYKKPSSFLSDKYEIYIKNITAYGLTDPLKLPPTGDSTITIANWITYDTNDDSDLLSTCAHELHHASQNKYIYLNAVLRQIWVIEGSAAWIEHEVTRVYYPKEKYDWISELDWWREELNEYLLHPDKSLTSGFPDGCPVGMYFWFLANNTQINFNGSKPQIGINKKIWEELSVHTWIDVMGAFNDALSDAPSQYNSFEESFKVFAIANYFKNEWYPPDQEFLANVSLTAVINFNGGKYMFPQKDLPEWASAYYEINLGVGIKTLNVIFNGEDTGLFWPHDFAVIVLGVNSSSYHMYEVNLNPDTNVGTITLNVKDYDKVVVIVIGLNHGGKYELLIEGKRSPMVIAKADSTIVVAGNKLWGNRIIINPTNQTLHFKCVNEIRDSNGSLLKSWNITGLLEPSETWNKRGYIYVPPRTTSGEYTYTAILYDADTSKELDRCCVNFTVIGSEKEEITQSENWIGLDQ